MPIVMQINLNNENNQNSAREGIAEWNEIKGLNSPLIDNLQTESIKDQYEKQISFLPLCQSNVSRSISHTLRL